MAKSTAQSGGREISKKVAGLASPIAPASPTAYSELLKQYSDLTSRVESILQELGAVRNEKAQLEEELSRNRTLAATGEMVARIVHEIRNPLGGMAGFADLLDQTLLPGDKKKEYVAKVIEGVESLKRIVNSLLAYSKPIELEVKEVRLQEILEHVLSHFEMELNRPNGHIRLQRRLASSQTFVRIDPGQFQQAILNVLQNASHAISGQGTIRVATEEMMTPSGQGIRITISDDGHGIHANELEKIFTPFYTSKESGTGLGLANVKKIVEAHRGEVKIYSEQGRGTSVEICLPQKPQE